MICYRLVTETTVKTAYDIFKKGYCYENDALKVNQRKQN